MKSIIIIASLLLLSLLIVVVNYQQLVVYAASVSGSNNSTTTIVTTPTQQSKTHHHIIITTHYKVHSADYLTQYNLGWNLSCVDDMHMTKLKATMPHTRAFLDGYRNSRSSDGPCPP